MKDVEKSQTSFIRVNLSGFLEMHLFQCPLRRPACFRLLQVSLEIVLADDSGVQLDEFPGRA